MNVTTSSEAPLLGGFLLLGTPSWRHPYLEDLCYDVRLAGDTPSLQMACRNYWNQDLSTLLFLELYKNAAILKKTGVILEGEREKGLLVSEEPFPAQNQIDGVKAAPSLNHPLPRAAPVHT